MTLNRALSKAVTHGWIGDNIRYHGILLRENPFSVTLPRTMAEVILDSKFWRALADAQKWPKGKWQNLQHALVDHLNEGGDYNEFFTSI